MPQRRRPKWSETAALRAELRPRPDAVHPRRRGPRYRRPIARWRARACRRCRETGAPARPRRAPRSSTSRSPWLPRTQRGGSVTGLYDIFLREVRAVGLGAEVEITATVVTGAESVERVA